MTVLITGVNGQMGSLLAEFLVKRGISDVVGVGRRSENFTNLESIKGSPNFRLEVGDIRYPSCADRLVKSYKPELIFNFAAISGIRACEDNRQGAFQVNVEGVYNLLLAVEKHCPQSVFITLGSTREIANNSFYSATKQMSRHIVDYFGRQGIKCAQPYISLNDSEHRTDPSFVSAKIIQKLKQISLAIAQGQDFEPLYLGNIDQIKYWGYSRDFVESIFDMAIGMFLLSDHKELHEYTNTAFFGPNHSVREFLELALDTLNIEYKRDGDIYYRLNSGIKLVVSDPDKFANDTDFYIDRSQFTHFGDYNKTPLSTMVSRMIHT